MVNKRRWLVLDAREPQPNRRDGRIEAVARTPIMGFRDDVVIRIRGVDEELARGYALVLALRIPRPRQQRVAHPRFPRQPRTDIDAALEREERRRPAPKEKAPPPKSKQGTPQAKR